MDTAADPYTTSSTAAGAAHGRHSGTPAAASAPAAATPALPATAHQAMSALEGLVRRRVCLRRGDGDGAVLTYITAVARIAAAAAAAAGAGHTGLAARVCRLAAALAAVLPTWRAAPLWQVALPPAVLMRLLHVMAGTQQGGPAAPGLIDWLQVRVP